MPFAGISLFTFKCLVEIEELLGAELFGANGRRPIQKFNGRLDFLLVVITAERVGESLSLLREGGTHKVKESVGRLDAWIASSRGVKSIVALSTFGFGVKCSGPILRKICVFANAETSTERLP